MTPYNKYSRRFHFVMLCCFLLPFFYTGCGQTREEKTAQEKEKQDSAASTLFDVNSVKQDSITEKSIDTTVKTNIPETAPLREETNSAESEPNTPLIDKDAKTPSQKILNEFPFLRPVLISKPDTYSGIASVIDSIPFISFFAISISFLLLILCLTVKFIDSNARKTIVLLEIVALIFLSISHPYSWDSEKLWGFGVALAFVSAVTLYDLYLIRLVAKMEIDNKEK